MPMRSGDKFVVFVVSDTCWIIFFDEIDITNDCRIF